MVKNGEQHNEARYNSLHAYNGIPCSTAYTKHGVIRQENAGVNISHGIVTETQQGEQSSREIEHAFLETVQGSY